MVDTSWANLVISYHFDKYFIEVDGMYSLLNFAQSYYIKT